MDKIKLIIAKSIMHILHKLFLILFSPVLLPALTILWAEETIAENKRKIKEGSRRCCYDRKHRI